MSENLYRARYWNNAEEKTVVCKLCPRKCKIKNNKRGLCYVRKNCDGKLILTAYGRCTGIAIDPIEKKPLYHFYPHSRILSLGTAGCNLTCKFCQNWSISRSKQMDTMMESASPEEIAKSAYNTGCKSMAFTYNEPIIFMEYAIDTALACHKLGIKTVAVTAGYIREKPRKEFFSHMDAVNIDLKSFNPEFYRRFTGAELEVVLDTILHLKNDTQCWFEITTLLIPGENDSPKEINSMTSWIMDNLGPDVPLHFSAFHPDYKLTHKPRTPIETLIAARDIAIKNGLNYVYTGNVHSPATGSTYCPQCKKKIIEREVYSVGKIQIKNGQECSYCGAKVAGVF